MNRLAMEKSPYLLQHADNPVDWYAWSPEAFDKAKAENKPVLLSIGYSTCHWCHVMEHESFEDKDVAALMNDAFVCIKVDREERPDIDNIYMAVCQALTGSGGWPLTIFLTPGQKPFFAGTYIPKHDRYGRQGLMSMIPRVKELWEKKQRDVERSASEITDALQHVTAEAAGSTLDESTLKSGFDQLARRSDRIFGGFGDSPKFPTPHQHLFLLRYWKRTGDARALEMVEKTLQGMRRGGIYDHAGFGFHRYSTDREWLVPHFEKMLYDQALLGMAYVEAFQATGNYTYARTAREIYTYVLRDMTDSQGGFYSAEDADSEGEEGKFYFWKAEEIDEILGNEAALFKEIYNVEDKGNFIEQMVGHRTGDNILHVTKPLSVHATERKMSEPELRDQLEANRIKLFELREERIHPLKDDKILVDWNGLMIASLAKASVALDEPRYAEAAARAADFVLGGMRRPDGSLIHRFRQGEAAFHAHIDDYAFFMWGLIELYQADFEVRYLEKAIDLTDYLLNHFWDSERGGFFFTADNGEALLVRTKEIYDGAVPSGNSVAMYNLLRLSRLTGNMEYERKAEQIGQAFSNQVSQASSAHSLLLAGLDFQIGPSLEVVIAGAKHTSDTQTMLNAVRSGFVPNKVVLFRPEEDPTEIVQLAPFIASQKSLDDRATVYVCCNFVCNLPTTDPAEVVRLIG